MNWIGCGRHGRRSRWRYQVNDGWRADAAKDAAFLEETLRGAWRIMPGDSPNAGAGRHRVRILKAGFRHRRTLKVLLGLLCEGFPESAGAF